MKKHLISILFVLSAFTQIGAGIMVLSACSTPANQRVVAVQSLLAVGQSAEGAVTLSAKLYQDGKITAIQARAVMDFYDQKFQPAYRLAAAAVQSDLSSPASPELVGLGAQLVALVNSYVK